MKYTMQVETLTYMVFQKCGIHLCSNILGVTLNIVKVIKLLNV